MGRPITQERSVGAGSQFTGTEFSVSPPSAKPGAFLKLRELNLKMGTESKTWRVEKVSAQGNVLAVVQQSTDATGSPAPNSDESVVLRGEDVELLLERGEQFQVTTSGATAAMRAKVYLEEQIFE